MKPLTVNELSALLEKAIKFGYGDRIVCVSDDEECNGYHCLYNHNFGSGYEIQHLDKDGNIIKCENSIIID